MKEYYVTLFNKLYLPQGLSLFKSLEKVSNNFVLYIVCVDHETFEIIRNLNLSKVKLIPLSDYEDFSLKELKKTRTIAEYCWTLTPLVIEWVFKVNVNIKRLTYLDADIFFLNSPRPIFEEFEKSEKGVLITKHAYSPKNDYSHITGKFVVQFIIFERNKGFQILQSWKNECINWCFDRYEEGKYGDQKYLESWPSKYPDSVHILNKESYAMGPWNIERFPYSDCIFYHFHGLKILSNKELFLGNYKIPIKPYRYIYLNYAKEIKKIINNLEENGFKILKQSSKRKIIFTLIKRKLSLLLNFLKETIALTSFINISK